MRCFRYLFLQVKNVEVVIERGEPGPSIIDAAKTRNADFIFTGTRGLSAFEK